MSIDTFLLSADTTDLNYPEVRPTLDLNFARVKALDPRITFTRASGGSYVGADGLIKYAGVNQARFDHDPYTGESLGLLVEESRSNLLLRSEDFSLWSVSNGSVQSNVITAPDGNTTADKLVENSASGNKEVSRSSITFTSGTSLTFSCFVKAEERNLFRFGFTTGFFASGTSAYFNLSNGTVSLIQGGITSASIIPYPNGWYRCVATVLPTSSGSGNVHITLVRSGTQPNYVGDGTSGIYLWGAQLEEGAFPTSYIPTEASTRTRAADDASITGKNFSDWYNPTEGTLYVRANTDAGTSLRGVAALNLPSNFTNNRVDIRYYQSGNSRALFNNSANLSGTSGFNFNNPKFIASYAENSTAYRINTEFYQSTNSYTPSTNVNTLIIGNFDAGTLYYLCGTISRLTYYPKRLPNAQLQVLTR